MVEGLEGMIIGAVHGVHITVDTPIDHDQWEDGKPWHIRATPQRNGAHSAESQYIFRTFEERSDDT